MADFDQRRELFQIQRSDQSLSAVKRDRICAHDVWSCRLSSAECAPSSQARWGAARALQLGRPVGKPVGRRASPRRPGRGAARITGVSGWSPVVGLCRPSGAWARTRDMSSRMQPVACRRVREPEPPGRAAGLAALISRPRAPPVGPWGSWPGSWRWAGEPNASCQRPALLARQQWSAFARPEWRSLAAGQRWQASLVAGRPAGQRGWRAAAR